MTMCKTKVCLYSAPWRKDAVGVLLVVALVLWVAVVSAASASETTQVPFTSRNQRPDKLPCGVDPTDVVRMTHGNRGGLVGDRAGAAEPPESAPVSAADPVVSAGEVGPAFLIGGPVDVRFAGLPWWNPAIASDGKSYLVVWSDGEPTNYDIHGARVSATGTVLDSGNIAVCTAGGDQDYPAVAFDGVNYLVVWERGSYWSSDSWCWARVYGARVSATGTVLDTASIAISTLANCQGRPVVASDGTNSLVVWHDDRNGPFDIYGARVSAAGTVLDTAGIAICTVEGGHGYPAVAFDATNYLVVWIDGRGGSSHIYGARVSMAGAVLDTAGIAICTAAGSQMYPAVAFDGANYLVVWQDDRGDSSHIYGARVSMAGAVLDTAGIPISTGAGGGAYPAIAFDGTNYLVVWMEGGRHVHGARVSAAGVVLDTAGIAIPAGPSSGQWYPVIASGPICASLVAYTDYPSAFASWPPSGWSNYGRIYGNIWKAPRGTAFASASATAHSGCVSLSWQMTADVSEYSFVIQRSESHEGEFTTIDLPISRGADFSFSCRDYGVSRGKAYWYKIVLANSFCEQSPVSVEVQVEPLPAAYRVNQSYPNPFNPLCTIEYEITWAGKVSLRVFDLGGSPVRTLVDAWREPGVYSEVWDGRDDSGKRLASGVYFYRLETGDVLEAGHFVATRKTVLLR